MFLQNRQKYFCEFSTMIISNKSMFLPKKFFILILFLLTSSKVIFASFPILPEIQVYHTVGSRGSNYSTGALGLSLHLYDEEDRSSRYLHLLALSIPKETAGWKSKVGGSILSGKGSGFELGVHDQWVSPSSKGATLSIRKITWPKLILENSQLGEGTSDILHMGWSWISGRPIITVWLMSIDIASLNLPKDRKIEIELGLGMRTFF